ncbi:MAG: hypothetical protein AMS20_00250 [Gemmatimonas sp. SG8_28]|nr:MAG: hypothetical protein AMS20_00250 [Gemmatimonas sp. SG8_28]
MDTYTFDSRPHDQESVNAWADIALSGVGEGDVTEKFLAKTSGPISVVFKNTDGANSIDVKVLGSNDPNAAVADRVEVVASATIAAGAIQEVEIALAYYQFYWFQFKATTGGNQGNVRLWGRQARV